MSTFMWTTGDRATLTPMMPAMRAANIDVVHSYSVTPSTTEAETNLYLDALSAAGLKAMLNIMPLGRNLVYDRPSKGLTTAELQVITDYANRYKDHPALWGWYTDDEGAAANYPISTRQQVYDTVKAADPAHKVLEAHWYPLAGAYSASCHDVYCVHAGTSSAAAYLYKYDTFPNAPDYGCISTTTGLVTSRSREATALAAFQSNLAAIRTVLVGAGETEFFTLYGAFKQNMVGTMKLFAFPPVAADGYDGGLTRMWQAAQAANMADHAGWFLWYYPPYVSGTPFEHLDGVGQTGYEAQLVELGVIAAEVSDLPYAALTATPTPSNITLDWIGTATRIERRVV